jgi:hypothetical protein
VVVRVLEMLRLQNLTELLGFALVENPKILSVSHCNRCNFSRLSPPPLPPSTSCLRSDRLVPPRQQRRFLALLQCEVEAWSRAGAW